MSISNDLLIRVLNSGLFDANYYAVQRGLSFESEKAALADYFEQCLDPELKPSSYFDPAWYLETFSDVANSNTHPLLHFVLFGAFEGRCGYTIEIPAQLLEVDRARLNGEPERAEMLLNALEDEAGKWSNEIQFRKASLLFYRAEYEKCLKLVRELLERMTLYQYPQQYRQLNYYHTHASIELDQIDEARSQLYEGFGGFEIWSYGLELYRHTVKSEKDLAIYKQLFAPSMRGESHEAAQALRLYSMAAKAIGSYSKSIKALKQRYLLLSAKSPVEHSTISKKGAQDWQERAQIALCNLKQEFERMNEQFFLISGTLLGCIREQDFLAHDKDIDVGVLESVSLKKITDCLRGSGNFTIQHHVTDRVIQVRHFNGVYIDIFSHWERDGKFHHSGLRTGWMNTPFKLKKTIFVGEDYLIPDDPELYLSENYGSDWVIPKIDYDTFNDTLNMYVTDENSLYCYYLTALADYYVDNRLVKYKQVWSALKKLRFPGIRLMYRNWKITR
jgi:hypothetical protein